jgi:putative ABC transport system permease protein
VVLSDALWRTRFASARDIVGRSVRFDDQTYTVVGVMPPSFDFPYGRRQFWVPLSFDGATADAPVRVNLMARVRRDLTMEAADARVAALTPAAITAGQLRPGLVLHVTPPLARHLNAPIRRALYVLAGAVSLVLFIACANLANLLLVQGAGRGREMAIRTALGASRRRLVRQLLTETMLLAAVGGVLGLLIAQWTIDIIGSFAPRELTFLNTHAIALDMRVVLFAIAVTVVTAAFVGVLPAFRASGLVPHEALKDGRSSTAAPRQERLRRAFVLTQVALALVLLVGAGLMTRTFAHLTRIDPGFDPHNVIAVDIALPRWKYATRAAQTQFFDDVSARIRRLPSVMATTVTGGVPPGAGGISFDLKFEIEGRGVVLEDPQLLLPFSEVDGDYFRTMGIPLKAGRTFSSADTPESPRVIIIGEDMARRLWVDESPVGHRIRFDDERPWYTVVGVAGNVYQFRHDQPHGQFAVYYPNTQSRGIPAQQTLVVRIAGDPRAAAAEIRKQIWAVDPGQPIARLQTLDDAYAEFLATPRFYAFLMGAFAFIGLVISTVGLYGVLAYAIAQRTREFGIRTALGAPRAQVMKLALRSGLVVTAVGIVTGLAGSVALGPAMEALLVDIAPTDPATYVVTVLTLATASAAACWVPARRATRVDPLVALRHE